MTVITNSRAEPHQLLAQVPLTVSPFISLPTSTSLPYTYRTLPLSLPPSATEASTSSDGFISSDQARSIVTTAGEAAHPDSIHSSCTALQTHLRKNQDNAGRQLQDWLRAIAARELAEKRRVAPGWLDSDAKLLEPQRKMHEVDRAPGQRKEGLQAVVGPPTSPSTSDDEGAQLDLAFGRMSMEPGAV